MSKLPTDGAITQFVWSWFQIKGCHLHKRVSFFRCLVLSFQFTCLLLEYFSEKFFLKDAATSKLSFMQKKKRGS